MKVKPRKIPLVWRFAFGLTLTLSLAILAIIAPHRTDERPICLTSRLGSYGAFADILDTESGGNLSLRLSPANGTANGQRQQPNEVASPDESHVAWIWYSDATTQFLTIIDLHTSRKATFPMTDFYGWSEDGQFIAFNGPADNLTIVDAQTLEPVWIKPWHRLQKSSLNGDYGFYIWSGSGHRFAYLATEDGITAQLIVVSPGESAQSATVIPDVKQFLGSGNSQLSFALAWSLYGQHVAIINETWLGIYDTTRGTFQLVTDHGYVERNSALNIKFVRNGSSLFYLTQTGPKLFDLMSFDTQNETHTIVARNVLDFPELSPKRKYGLLEQFSVSNGTTLSMLAADTGVVAALDVEGLSLVTEYWAADESAVLLAFTDGYTYHWYWSATDGSTHHWLDGIQGFEVNSVRLEQDNLVIIDGHMNNTRYLKAIDLKAGTERILDQDYPTEVRLWPSPNGKLVVVTPNSNPINVQAKPQIKLIALETGWSHTVTTISGDEFRVVWSPENDKFALLSSTYFTYPSSSINVYSADGTPINRLPLPLNLNVDVWSTCRVLPQRLLN